MRRAILVLAAVLGLLSVARAAGAADGNADREYPVSFDRPSKAGDRLELQCSAAQVRNISVTVGGQKQDQPEHTVLASASGVMHVLDVDGNGEPTKLTFTIKSSKVTVGDAAGKPIAPEGAVITAERDGKKTKFTSDKGELDEAAREGLGLVFDLREKEVFVKDDLVFGTERRQKVGAAWPVRAEQAAKALADVGDVKPEQVSGTMKLVAVETADGVECVKVSGTLTVKDFVPKLAPDAGFPPGLKPETGRLEGEFGGLFPLDAKLPQARDSMTLTATMSLAGKLGEAGRQVDARVEVTVKEAKERRYTAAK